MPHCTFSIFLRIFIFSSLLFLVYGAGLPQDQPVRIVNLKIVVDEEFRIIPTWRSDINWLIRRASEEFEKRFSISLRMDLLDGWISDNAHNTVYGLLNDLRKKVSQDNYDIVLGLTGQHCTSQGLSGAATYLHGYIILKESKLWEPRSKTFMKSLLLHELCHLFGAVDLNEKSSIMNRKNPGSKFDEFTRRIVLLNRNRNFNPHVFPLPESQLDEAIAVYKQRKKLNRKEADIHIMLALFYLEKKDYKSTLNECFQAIQIDSHSTEAYNISGIAYRRQGRIDEAIQLYKKVLRLQPNYLEIHYNLGIAYAKKGLTNEAINAYKKAIELNPNFAEAYANLGLIYVRERMADKAIEVCQKALELYPQFDRATSTLGGAYILKNNYKEAEPLVRKALQLNPELSGAHNNLGNIYMHKIMVDEAIQEYLEALKIDPEFKEAHHNLGRAYLLIKLYDKAIAEFKEAIKLKPDYFKAYSNMASAYLKKGMAEEAIQSCQKAIEIKPDYASAYSNLGYAYLEKEMVKEAKEACQKAIALDPELPASHNLLGSLFEKENRIEEARQEYLKAVELNPELIEAHMNLGNLYFKMNLLPDSAVHYKKVVEINPSYARAYNNLAVISFYQKKYSLAHEYLKKTEALGFKVHPDFKKEVLRMLKEKRKK